MAKISDLPDELLVKILSFLPTKVAVSTSILSKQWKFLWMWLPTLRFYSNDNSMRDFLYKNLPLHKAPIIERLILIFNPGSLQADDSKSWEGIAVSRVRELNISYYLSFREEDAVFLFLPKSLYTSNSLVTLRLDGEMILVDVPRAVCLPSLKTLELSCVTYSNEDSLRLLLSYCPVLEELNIVREGEDNMGRLVIIVPTLQRLSLSIDEDCSSDGSVIVTPSLRYFQVQDNRSNISYMIEHMPKLEEADITVMQDNHIDIDKLLKSITAVKHLSVCVPVNSGNETVYGDGIVFSQLENLKLYICSKNWSKILLQLLKDSPNLQILDVEIDNYYDFGEYKPVSWNNNESLVPECLLKSLKTFKFERSSELDEEERDFLSFIFKHARCFKSISILC